MKKRHRPVLISDGSIVQLSSVQICHGIHSQVEVDILRVTIWVQRMAHGNGRRFEIFRDMPNIQETRSRRFGGRLRSGRFGGRRPHLNGKGKGRSLGGRLICGSERGIIISIQIGIGSTEIMSIEIILSIGKFIFNNGDVGIGTTTPAAKLDVNGNISVVDEVYFNGVQRKGSSGTGTPTYSDIKLETWINTAYNSITCVWKIGRAHV